MNNYFILLIIIYLAILYSCRNNSPWNQLHNENERVQVINFDSKTNKGCAYIIDDLSRIKTKMCISNNQPFDTIINYYPSGIPKVVILILDGKDNSDEIYYHDNGMIYKTMSIRSNKVEGILKIYYRDGYLKAINLTEHDSIYYIRAYPDSLTYNYTENIKPIINFDKDTANIDDTISFNVRLPFSGWNGIQSSDFEFHHDDIPLKDLILGYFLPRFTDTFVNDQITGYITASDTGRFQFFGYVTRKGNPSKYNMIKKEFVILNKNK